MVLDCCCRVLKCVLVVVDIIVTIAGIALLTFGTSAFMTLHELQVSPSGSFEDVKTITYYGAISFLVVGAILSIIGVCGCCGALTESQCLLMTFTFVVLGCFVLTVSGIVLLTLNKSEITNMAKSQAKNVTDKEAFGKKHECCFQGIPADTCGTKSIAVKKDCVEKTYANVSILTNSLTIVLVLNGIFQILAFISSIGLCCHIRKAGY